ncbi:kanamycin nucleotidyltransferase C-terminal domain-containing protein [Ectobacillus antri]|uniref:kanamycin nucleotidyltransferase C-terminal domain-containing protein n=1 Tax=Ectobacillus antri TaxID=2486280 RepID=UPI000F592216|nr:kanamycin nucleotidyltransferase C-terminal domain-containing protein [Ectobacillus antri]
MKKQLWEPKRFSEQERWEIISEIVEKLKDTYEDELISIAVEGSTAKGLAKPQSDLEFRVVLKGQNYHRWHAFFYKEMFVGISYNSVDRIENEGRFIDYEWPIKGDAVHTAKVLYDPHHLYDFWRKEAKIGEAAADFKELLRDALADMYEHVYKMFLCEDDLSRRQQSVAIAHWAVMSVGLANRHQYPSNKTMLHDSFRLPDVPVRYEELLRKLLCEETAEAAGELWFACKEWGQLHGIDMHDEQLRGL